MQRRQFFKQAGLGSVGLLLASKLAENVAVAAEPKTSFTLIANVLRVGGTDRILASGSGSFGSAVQGGGSFTHFQPTSAGTPFPILGFGSWTADTFMSFTPTSPPDYGAHIAGVLEIDVTLLPEGGSPIPATMKVVCNIGAGNLSTGQPEGIVLTIPGIGTFGPGGLTLFSAD